MGSQLPPLLLLALVDELLVPEDEALDEEAPDDEPVLEEDALEDELPVLVELVVEFPPPAPKGRLSSLPSAQLASMALGRAMMKDRRKMRDNLMAIESPRARARFRRD